MELSGRNRGEKPRRFGVRHNGATPPTEKHSAWNPTMAENVTLTLTENQAALILETTEEGEITVNIHAGSEDLTLAAALCEAIAERLVSDEEFQQELMDSVGGEDEE